MYIRVFDNPEVSKYEALTKVTLQTIKQFDSDLQDIRHGIEILLQKELRSLSNENQKKTFTLSDQAIEALSYLESQTHQSSSAIIEDLILTAAAGGNIPEQTLQLFDKRYSNWQRTAAVFQADRKILLSDD